MHFNFFFFEFSLKFILKLSERFISGVDLLSLLDIGFFLVNVGLANFEHFVSCQALIVVDLGRD